jgi:signal transduction histidine kinase
MKQEPTFDATRAPAVFDSNPEFGLAPNLSAELEALRHENNALRQAMHLSEGLRQRFEALYDGAPTGSLTLSADDHITDANFTIAHLFNVERGRLIGQHMGRFIAENDHAAYIQHLTRVRETGGTDICDLNMIDRNGNPFAARLKSTASPVNPDNSPQIGIGIITSVRCIAGNEEISDHRQVEKELQANRVSLELTNNQLRKEIEEREQAEEQARQHQERLAHVARLNTVGEMASGFAHEINQPLAAIVTYTQSCLHRLRADADPAQLQGILEQVIVQTQRAAKIIRHLRNFVAKSGKPHREPIDIGQIVRFAVSMVRHELIRNQIKLDISPDESLPVVVADSIQIEQVVLNLLRNATEAMSEVPVDSRRLRIDVGSEDPDHVSVAIHDSGPGIASDDHDKIATPFFSTKSDGMGLGLVISRTIVEDHGGRLVHRSNPEGGATFHFTLAVGGRRRDYP